MMTVRAVLFDLGDTLFALGPLPRDMAERVRRALPESLRGGELARAIADAVAEASADRHVRGAHDEVDLPGLVASLLPQDEQDRSAIAASVTRAFGHADIRRWQATAETAQRVAQLRGEGLRIAFVSNTTTPAALMRLRLHEMGLLGLADAAVFSSEVGWRKPAPVIYQRALAALRVSAADAVFVGDRVREDVVAPQQLGMRGVLTYEFRQEPPGAAQPAAIIRELPELAALLRRWH